MPPSEPSGMQNRLSSSSSPTSPSLPSVSSTTPRPSISAVVDSLPPPSLDDNSPSEATPSSPARGNGRSPLGRRSSTSSSSPRPSLFSRLSLPIPLRTRKRHVADFHIRPSEPHRQYMAGDHVRGSVVLAIVKPIRITHLTVSLCGYVRVFKDPALGAKAQGVAPSSLPQGSYEHPQYHGNGLASLFQDEQVLSGDGRLDPGKYEFGFDLVFPSKDLPSSIDFERGSISYMISATLTRPTSIGAVTSCDRKVSLVNKLDIGQVRTPSPRTIFLEPVSKRNRKKRSIAQDKVAAPISEAGTDIGSEAGSAAPSVATEDSNHDRASDPRYVDQSDIRSEFSGESSRSVSTSGLSRADLAQVASAKQQAVDEKTIIATVEILKGGCLPGDTVTVRISVQHIKRLKSMTGIIVTLFREGRIDTNPDAGHFSGNLSKEERKQMEKLGSYPKSKTRLGGMGLASTNSQSSFRKELDQNTAPLIVNPATLQTTVTVQVKVPDDSFPSIKGVPGNMIAFTYMLEVIVDLGGRLASRFRGGKEPKLGHFGNNSFDGTGSGFSARRGPVIADTAPLRREKGVIAVKFETVVGSTDSGRGRAQPRISPSSRTLRTTLSDDDEAYLTEHSQPEDSHHSTPFANGHPSSGYFPAQPSNSRYQGQTRHQPSSPNNEPPQPYPYTPNGESSSAPAYIPPPQLPDEQALTEKQRIRQAETRLLPSQPPAGPSSLGDDNIYDADETPTLPHANPSSPVEDTEAGPSAPTEDDLSRPTNVPQEGEDKQEQERRRLMNEASAPPEIPEDMDRRQGGGSVQDMALDVGPSAPSAPVLDDEDGYHGYGVGAGPSTASAGGHNEQLPAYER